MIVKVGASDAAGDQGNAKSVPDSRGFATPGDHRVYRRRIRRLKDIPGAVIRHPNVTDKDCGGRSYRAILKTKPGGPDLVAEGGKSRSGPKDRLLPDDCVHGHSQFKSSLKGASQRLVQDRDTQEHFEGHLDLGPVSHLGQAKHAMSAPRMPFRAASFGRNDEGHSYHRDRLRGVKPSKRHRQSTLHDHFWKDPAQKVDVKEEIAEITVGGLSKHDGSPSGFKRKNMMGLDKIIEPHAGKIFPCVPKDDQFLQKKRPKIRNEEARVRVRPGDSTVVSIGKKRASVSALQYEEGQFSKPPLKRRKPQASPSVERPANDCNYYKSEVGILSVIVGGHREELDPKHVEKAPRVKKNGQPDGRFKKIASAVLQVGDFGRAPSILLPVKEEVGQDSVFSRQKVCSNSAADNKQSRKPKDGWPDTRFKNKGYPVLDIKSKKGSRADFLETVDGQAMTALTGEIHAKKLPEVQKNGVRKPKRVQLKQLSADKPDLPSGNRGNKPRIAKSLWSPPKQMKHIAEAGLVESFAPHSLVKCRKFVSLHQLDDPGKLDKEQGRQLTPLAKQSEDCSASDQTMSDCSPEINNQTGQAFAGITSQSSLPINPHKSEDIILSLPLKESSREKGQDTEQETALDKGKRSDATDSQNICFKNKNRLSPLLLRSKRPSGDVEVSSIVSEMTLKMVPASVLQMEDMTNGVLEEEIDDLVTTPRSVTHSASGEQTAEVLGGDLGANCVPRMTPRTRKLTDAMQNFIHQKASLLRQWKQMELGNLHPMALIGRSCKIFWPLDGEWYPGVIHEYNPQTRRHRIDYKDDEREWVHLGKERVKLHVSAEESKGLELSFGEGSPTEQTKTLDAEELAVLAAGMGDCQGELSHGDLVWGKVKGYPLWPAFVMDEEHASVSGLEPAPRERTVPVQFFGSYDHSRINTKKIVPFSKGIVHKYHTKCRRTVFEQGLQEVERYLKECKLPEQMAQLQEELDSVASKTGNDLSSTDDTDQDDQEFAKNEADDKSIVAKPSTKTACTFPLELGTLRVLTIGEIVRDSEQFHTENFIWTDGYIAIRKYASMKDPETMVDYRMEVLRHPTTPLLPLFRVTPEDEKPVEDTSASGCWKKILIKIQRAKEKAGLCIATLLEKKRQAFKSGPSMFGFSSRKVSKLIQALPNARVCSKFTAWIEKPLPEQGVEELAPAGYRPVEFDWKHLDRCNVCYLDEEYADNQLLQCDKCRTMVHMNCYGEVVPPDGDLWLCNLCRPGAPKRRPICCLCPVAGGAMKATTDGRWAHLTCAMWTPETCLVDLKRMEPVDGISSINKERWKLICTVCKVPYGACIQCSKTHCRVAFHPLCARAADLCMEVLDDKSSTKADMEGAFQLLTYCKKHKGPAAQAGSVRHQSLRRVIVPESCSTVRPPCNPSGCARGEPYSSASRRGHRQPEALAAALAKRFFVENRPYIISGCQRNVPKGENKSLGGSLWSFHWKQLKPRIAATLVGASNDCEADGEKTPQSTSERYRHMRSTLHERLTFGKSAIHGWGVFTKRCHNVGDMVIEYAGEIVRPIVADMRERRSYDTLVGAGTYMFRIDDERVVDATHAGSIAHLINHSCEPNCYSRVVAASGDDHIIIFAKRDISEGEELTYDYRFSSKDELLTCYCGCTGCRGSVNTFDSEEEPARVFASRSELTKWIV